MEEYELPDADDPSRMDGVVKWAKYLHKETPYAVVGMVGGPRGVFEISEHYVRGFDRFLIDFVENTALAEAMMDKAMDLALDINRVLLDEDGDYLDLVQAGNDLGHQHGLIMSPRMYRKLVKLRHKKMDGDISKWAPNVKILLHICGAIEFLLGDPIDVHLEIANPIQPPANGRNSEILKCRFEVITDNVEDSSKSSRSPGDRSPSIFYQGPRGSYWFFSLNSVRNEASFLTPSRGIAL